MDQKNETARDFFTNARAQQSRGLLTITTKSHLDKSIVSSKEEPFSGITSPLSYKGVGDDLYDKFPPQNLKVTQFQIGKV